MLATLRAPENAPDRATFPGHTDSAHTSPTARLTDAHSRPPELLPRTDLHLRRGSRVGVPARLVQPEVRPKIFAITAGSLRNVSTLRRPPHGHCSTSRPYTRNSSSAHSVRGRLARVTPAARAAERDTHRAADPSPTPACARAGTTALRQPAPGARIP